MTMQELYDKVTASEELKTSFSEAAKSKETLEAWLKEQGCTNTAEEVGEFLKAKSGKSGELDDDELENVAGGGTSFAVTVSIITAGTACAALAGMSAIMAKEKHKSELESARGCLTLDDDDDDDYWIS